MTLPTCSTRWCKAGSTTTDASTSPGCIHCSDASTSILFDGPGGNTNGCRATTGGRDGGWCASPDVIRRCLPTGNWACGPTAGQWERCALRGACTVLREPGGEIPPGHSPQLHAASVTDASGSPFCSDRY